MVFDLNQKVALITGGASGIGLAFAKTLLRNGAKGVTLADINSQLGQKAVKDIEKEFGNNKAIYIETDVCNSSQFEDAFKKTIETFKNIDILFNNAGILNDALWQKEIAINMNGTVHGMLLGLENYLQKYRQGDESVIVNTASIAGLGLFANIPIYAGTKAAIIEMTRSWGVPHHYDRTKVRCVAICPGPTATPLMTTMPNKNLGEHYENFPADPSDIWPTQEPEYVAEETLKIIQAGGNGTTWVIEGNQPAYQYIFPDRLKYTPK